MSTEHMPTPPDRITNQASPPKVETQPAPPAAPAETGAEAAAAPLPLNEDMARVLEEQAEIIVQRQMYHSQMMVGVSALGNDPVSARNAVLTVANALRNRSNERVEYALINLGDAQLEQVNDQTLPWKFNAQVAGLLEGLLLDTFQQAYRGDAQKQREARGLLEGVFLAANEQAEKQHKAQLAFLAPGPHPNARK